MFTRLPRFTSRGASVSTEAGTPPAGGGGLGFTLTDAPAGTWCWFADPRAVYYNGNTYFGYIKTNGDVCARSYNHAGGTVTAEFVLHSALEVDDHDNPTVHVRPSDHKLMYFYTKHSGPNMYLRTSTNAEDVSAFGAETTIEADFGSGAYTYPTPVYHSSGTSLFVFVRAPDSTGWVYNKSTDGGTTWGGVTSLHSLTYSKVESNGTDRVDVACSLHPNAGSTATKIYHLYRQDGSPASWYKSNGIAISSPPFDTSEMTLVYDGGTKRVWIWDIAYKTNGDPVIAFVQFESETDHRYYYADWDGSAWNSHQVISGGSYISVDVVGGNPLETYYSGGIVLDHEDPTTVYYSKQAASGQWEMYRATTVDAGVTWTETALTADSLVKQFRPFAVRDHASALHAIWLNGTFNSYVDYNVGLKGVAAP